MTHNRHALVTGGGRGIGQAIALALDGQGITVSLLGRSPGPLEETHALLRHGGAILQADVTNNEQVAAAVAQAEAAHGPLGILVNNAGAAASAPLEKTDPELWQRMLAVNLTGVYACCHAALPSLKQASNGRIINVASTAGLRGYGYVSAYCAAKHGVIGFTRALALELAKTDCTVNAVCPGYTETDLLANSIQKIQEATGMDEERARKTLMKDNPQGRFIQPDEVAGTVLWLCSAEARSITGQSLLVAGGELM